LLLARPSCDDAKQTLTVSMVFNRANSVAPIPRHVDVHSWREYQSSGPTRAVALQM
jgi:hypothetical protein